MKKIIKKYRQTSLILRIVIGMAVGILLALALPGVKQIGMAGTLFVRALKAIAPILVAVLVTASLAQRSAKLDKRFGLVIFLSGIGCSGGDQLRLSPERDPFRHGFR